MRIPLVICGSARNAELLVFLWAYLAQTADQGSLQDIVSTLFCDVLWENRIHLWMKAGRLLALTSSMHSVETLDKGMERFQRKIVVSQHY
jgi:hypothetical protein